MEKFGEYVCGHCCGTILGRNPEEQKLHHQDRLRSKQSLMFSSAQEGLGRHKTMKEYRAFYGGGGARSRTRK